MKDKMNRDVYCCIDMKTFYASVECAERHLNPFETDLVVADVSRGAHALCLAVTPHMKQQGVKNRCRLSDIPKHIRYRIAPPRMQLYINYAARIYDMYLDFFSRDDIYIYSIDEVFIDLTGYMRMYRTTPEDLVNRIIQEIGWRFSIPAAAGIGSNLYLAKVALDILAKHEPTHMARLDEESYRKRLGKHRPITDFWQIADGTARRLSQIGVFDMDGILQMPTDLVFRIFGRDGELLMDHAAGRESCRIEDILSYKPIDKSVSFSQILPRNYNAREARIIVAEMAVHGAEELMRRRVVAQKIGLYVGYSFGEKLPAKGSVRMNTATQLASPIEEAALSLYDAMEIDGEDIRRIGITFEKICSDGCTGYDVFMDFEAVEKERRLQSAVLNLHTRFGKNSVLRGLNYLPGAMQRERNGLIGGHRAGLPPAPGVSRDSKTEICNRD